MGVTQRLGTIPLAIQTDSSNNVGIGGAANASYKLAVTGASLFSSTLQSGVLTVSDVTASALLYNTFNNTVNRNWALTCGQGSLGDFNIMVSNAQNGNPISAGSVKFNIQSNGNVGIGTSSPLGFTSYTTTQISNTAGAGLFVESTTGGILGQFFADNGYAGGASVVFGSRSNHPLTFGTNNTERMRITSAGRIGIGTTIPDWFFSIQTSSGGYVLNSSNTRNVSGDVNAIFQLGNNCNNTSSYFLVCSMPIGDRMYIYGNGNVVNINNSYGVLSDIKLKENIVDATPKLKNLLKVKIRNYNLIGEETKQIGVIAQELEEIFPSMVEEVEDFKEIEVTDEQGNTTKERQSLGTTTKSVKMSVFVPMLIKAMQEQQEIINQLSAKVTALENK